MGIISRVFLGAALGLLSLSGCVSQRMEPNEQPSAIRGVWLTNIDSEILFSPEGIATALDRLEAAGFNTIFPVVYNDGYTLHPSDVMADTWGEAYRQDTVFAAKGFDPLAALVTEGHRRKMLVIPWFEFGFAASYQQEGGHMIAARPEWASRNVHGDVALKNGFYWLDAFHPDVQQFVLDLVLEVVQRYDVDGIQGDDRLPALPSLGGYNEHVREAYRAETGREAPSDEKEAHWVQWRADRLSAFGKRLYTEVKAVSPSLIVSMSPSVYPWSKEEYLQDWPAWVREGQVDWLHPQNYRYDIAQYESTLDAIVAAFEEASAPHPVALAPGILIKAGPRYNGPAYVTRALDVHRERQLGGEVFFFYEGLFEQNENLADTLWARFYRTEAQAN